MKLVFFQLQPGPIMIEFFVSALQVDSGSWLDWLKLLLDFWKLFRWW